MPISEYYDSANEENYTPDQEASTSGQSNHISLEKKKKVVDFWLNGGRHRTLAFVQHTYTFVKSHDDLSRWRKQIERGKYV